MFQDQIRQIHVKINAHLDTLEHTILQELDDTEDKIRSNIDTLLKQLSKNATTIEGLQLSKSMHHPCKPCEVVRSLRKS